MRLLSSLLVLGFFASCESTNLMENRSLPVKHYLFVGHPYLWGTDTEIDPRMMRLNLEDYDQVWLGGDICVKTSKDPETLPYVDAVFNISDTNRVQWCLGNHDVREGSLETIENYIGRKSYYATHFNGITLVVGNTLFNNPQVPELDGKVTEEEKQIQFLQNVFDTIQNSQHVVLLLHHMIWRGIPELENVPIGANVEINNYSFSSKSMLSFQDYIYPYLEVIRRKGIKVWVVSGDFGMSSKGFKFEDENGVTFLGSGINNTVKNGHIPNYVSNFNPDKVLLFRHFEEHGGLHPVFQDLDSLLFVRGL